MLVNDYLFRMLAVEFYSLKLWAVRFHFHVEPACDLNFGFFKHYDYHMNRVPCLQGARFFIRFKNLRQLKNVIVD